MKAALCKSLDGPSGIAIEDVADPQPAAGEAVVRVTAAALNFLDTLITRGKYQTKPALPFSPAAEFAGIVEVAPAGADPAIGPGSRVFGYTGYGAAREKIAVPTDQLVPLPAAVPDDVGATLSVTYGTAIYGLRDRGRLRAGETVAVLGASGGAGLAAVEIAKLLGARVVACASSAEKLEVCRAHGADVTIDYKSEDLKQRLRDVTDGNGVDVVYDCVGAGYAEPAIRAMAWGGRIPCRRLRGRGYSPHPAEPSAAQELRTRRRLLGRGDAPRSGRPPAQHGRHRELGSRRSPEAIGERKLSLAKHR